MKAGSFERPSMESNGAGPEHVAPEESVSRKERLDREPREKVNQLFETNVQKILIEKGLGAYSEVLEGKV